MACGEYLGFPLRLPLSHRANPDGTAASSETLPLIRSERVPLPVRASIGSCMVGFNGWW